MLKWTIYVVIGINPIYCKIAWALLNNISSIYASATGPWNTNKNHEQSKENMNSIMVNIVWMEICQWFHLYLLCFVELTSTVLVLLLRTLCVVVSAHCLICSSSVLQYSLKCQTKQKVIVYTDQRGVLYRYTHGTNPWRVKISASYQTIFKPVVAMRCGSSHISGRGIMTKAEERNRCSNTHVSI